MVQKIFKISKSSNYSTGYAITAPDGTELELPESVINDLGRGKHYTSSNVAEFIDKIDTAAIALAGVTNSLNEVDHNYYMNNSVIKSIAFKNTGTIDDTIDLIRAEDDPEQIIKTYEKYHIITMGRDVAGNDNTIHAYIETPCDGKLRCTFDKSVRLEAKRNNVKYWIEDYKIDARSAGGKFVRPISLPIEM